MKTSLRSSEPPTLSIRIAKSGKSARLVPKKIWVIRDGVNYLTTVWVLPEEVNTQVSRGAQYGLFTEGEIEEIEAKKHLLSQLPPGATVQYVNQGIRKVGEISRVDGDVVSFIDGTKVPVTYVDMVEPAKKPEVIHKAIASATPETRAATTAALFGSQLTRRDVKPTEEDDHFLPKMTQNDKGIVMDYREVIPTHIVLPPIKSVLEEKRPIYIPPLEDRDFAGASYRVEAVKLGENDYIVNLSEGNPNKYARVSLDVLASMQDYYLCRAKALALERARKYSIKPKQIKTLPEYKTTLRTFTMSKEWLPAVDRAAQHKAISDAISDMKQKRSDIMIQLEENMSAYTKGEETSYGDRGVMKDLLASHGVFVKRQNGDPISRQEVADIKDALDQVFAIYGNRSEMARKFGLKISHSGKVLMHARKYAGMYFPIYRTIGVTMKDGPKEFGFTLAHEWAHFMDNYLGMKGGRYIYSSDDWGSLSGEIAKTFRKDMAKGQSSAYMNRTCECFARAFEQYFALKSGDSKDLHNTDGIYCPEDTFVTEVQPLIDQWFLQNDALLKSFYGLKRG